MDPKRIKSISRKRGIATSTPLATTTAFSRNFPEPTSDDSFVIHEAAEEVVVSTSNPTLKKDKTIDMICEAIKTIGLPRKGASYISIHKWIISNKESMDSNRLRPHLRKQIAKGLDSGLLVRATVSKDSTGVKGYFKISKNLPIKKGSSKVVKKAPKKSREASSDTEFEVPKRKAAIKAGIKTISTKEEIAKIRKPRLNAVIAKPKAEAASIPKSKAEAASIPKSKPEAALIPKSKPKAEAASIPKSKPKAAAASIPKSKAAAASIPKSKPKVAAASIPKSKPKAEAASIPKSKPKAEAASIPKSKPKAEAASIPKSKPKAAAASIPKSKTETVAALNPKSKPKVVAASIPKPNKVVATTILETVDTEEQISEQKMKKPLKVQEKDSKKRHPTPPPVFAEPYVKKLRTKRLYTPRFMESMNNTRRDLSDTEIEVNRTPRKSFRSYSSDTEIEFVKKEEASKLAGTYFEAGTSRTRRAVPLEESYQEEENVGAIRKVTAKGIRSQKS